jgi:hypothetical protein
MTFSLGLGGGGGGNYIRFSPSINAWQLGKDKEEIELKKIVFDLDSIKTGWGKMSEGVPPEWIWDDVVGRRSAKPEDTEFKRGFSVRVWLGPDRGWAEWSSNGTGPCMGFEALAGAAMADKADNPGKCVACAYKGSTAVKVGKGSTRTPNFEIVGWIDRPADDGDDEAPAPAPARSAPPSTGSRAVPPPAAKKQADLANMDFG